MNNGSIDRLTLLKPFLQDIGSARSADAFTTVFYAIFSSTLELYRQKLLSPEQVVTFVSGVVAHLPSSSSGQPSSAFLSEYLIDALWSVDVELEDILVEERKIANSGEQSGTDVRMKNEASPVFRDRTCLAGIVSQLLVRWCYSLSYNRERSFDVV